jgi:hypothetical protein
MVLVKGILNDPKISIAEMAQIHPRDFCAHTRCDGSNVYTHCVIPLISGPVDPASMISDDVLCIRPPFMVNGGS